MRISGINFFYIVFPYRKCIIYNKREKEMIFKQRRSGISLRSTKRLKAIARFCPVGTLSRPYGTFSGLLHKSIRNNLFQ